MAAEQAVGEHRQVRAQVRVHKLKLEVVQGRFFRPSRDRAGADPGDNLRK